MSLLERQTRGSFAPIISLGLVVLAFLVVAVKYVGPMLYYVSERMADRPLMDVPVMWDFWWPLYLLVAAQVFARSHRAWLLILGLGVARILWSVVVITLFFARPDWDFWGLQWLLYEVVALIWLATVIIMALTPAARDELMSRGRSGSF